METKGEFSQRPSSSILIPWLEGKRSRPDHGSLEGTERNAMNPGHPARVLFSELSSLRLRYVL